MAIDSFLKVKTEQSPKVDELKNRLAALQQKAQQGQEATSPVQQMQTGSVVSVSPPPQNQPERPLDRNLAGIDSSVKTVLPNPELKLREERTTNLIMNQIKELITLHTDASKRLKDIEIKNLQIDKEIETIKDKHEEMLQKMNTIDSRLEKFMGLYELVTNQYNPFAESKPFSAPAQTPVAAAKPSFASPVAAQKPPLTTKPAQDVIIKVEDNLTHTAASVQLSGEDHSKAQEQFKKVEELLAGLQKQHEENHVSETPKPVQQGMHTMFEGFETRLQSYLDKALAEKLHQHFTKLESSVQQEVRDALKEEIAAVQQDDRDVQQAFAELQELLQAQNKNREPLEDELSELSSEINRLREDVKNIPPNLYFRVAGGGVLKDIRDLKAALRTMPADEFASHVGGGRNDFADWVEHALFLPAIAKQLRDGKTQKDLLQVLEPTF